MALVQFQQDLNDMTRSQKGEVNFISVVSSLALQKHGIEDFNLFLIWKTEGILKLFKLYEARSSTLNLCM